MLSGGTVASKETQVWEADIARVISGAGQCWGGGDTQGGVMERFWGMVPASPGRGHSNRDLGDGRGRPAEGAGRPVLPAGTCLARLREGLGGRHQLKAW